MRQTPVQSGVHLDTPQSVSPGLIAPAPMAHTAILPAGVMQSATVRTTQSDIQNLSYAQIPGGASYAAAAPDGSLWVLSTQPSGADKFIWHYSGGSWTNISGLASRLSVAPNGTLYVINSGGGAFSYSGGTWTAFGGGCRDLTAAADGSLYVISNGGGSDGAIWHYASGTWTQQPGNGNRIAASWDTQSYNIPGGTITPGGFYVINSLGSIYYLGSSGYIQFPGAGSAVAPISGGLFVLGYPIDPNGNALYYYDLNNPGWSAKPGAGVSISTDGRTLYIISSSGAIYYSQIALAVTRTLRSGDSFQYSGTSTTTYLSTETDPNPSSTTTAQIAQSVSVLGGASFNLQANLFDVKSSETDSTPLQTSSSTLDSYYQIVPGSPESSLVNWGFHSSDSFGETLMVQYGNPAPGFLLLDRSPEISGDSWSNGPAARITETSPGGQSAVRTYSADGTYVDVTTYPSGSLSTPPPAPVTASIAENADGSGSYSLPLQGTANTGLSFSTPDPSGTITITAAFADGTSASFTSSVWWPQPLSLYQDLTTNNGTVQIPGSCAASATFGVRANSLTDASTRVDTVLGTVETITQTSYIVPKYGTVCVQLTDSLQTYYDYSGQASAILFGNGATPLTTETVSTTVGLVSATVGTSSATRVLDSASGAVAVADERSRLIARSERRRLASQRRFITAFNKHLFRVKK